MGYGYKGSFTVFFSMLILPVLMLFLVLLWLSRTFAERNDTLRITDAAGTSALGCYNRELTERYGLYGVGREDLERQIPQFLKANCTVPIQRIYSLPAYFLSPRTIWKGLFSYEIREIELYPVHTLQEQDVMMSQIVDFMEPRVLQEVLSQLLQSIGIVQDTIKGKGIQEQYAAIQRKLTDYNESYAELICCLYPEENQLAYITMTQEAQYTPQRYKQAVYHLHSGPSDEDLEVVAIWQETADELKEQNHRAEKCLKNLNDIISELKQMITAFQASAAQLPQTEQGSESICTMTEEINRLQETLWGFHHEIPEFQKTVIDNQKALKDVEEHSHAILEKFSTGEEIEEGQWNEYEQTAQTFCRYSGALTLEYKKTSGSGKLGLSAVWKWMTKWKTDLRKYGEDKNLLEEEDSSDWMPHQTEEELLSASLARIEEGADELGESLINHFLFVEYVIGMLQNLSDQVQKENGKAPVNLRGTPFEAGFLQNEGEYILHGTYNEYHNLIGTEYRILALRLALNTIHLVSDPEKQALLKTIADSTGGILAPGIGSTVAYGALVFLWATAESYVDFSILVQGGKVPLFKSAQTWQTDLKAILNKKKGSLSPYFEELPSEGLDYPMYLRILLLLTDPPTCIKRLQSIIQLNLKTGGQKEFILAEHMTEFKLSTRIQGRTAEYGSQGCYGYE